MPVLHTLHVYLRVCCINPDAMAYNRAEVGGSDASMAAGVPNSDRK